MTLYLDASYDGRKMPRRSVRETVQITIRDENGGFVGNFEFRRSPYTGHYAFETRTSQAGRYLYRLETGMAKRQSG